MTHKKTGVLLLKYAALLLFMALPAAIHAKSDQEYIKDLKSQDKQTVINAARYLGDEKVTDGIEPLIKVIERNQDTDIRVAAITALGRMEQKGRPTSYLSSVVQSDPNYTVVYTSLLAMLSLEDFENPDAEKALNYADQNHQADPYIADIVKRVKKAKEES